MYCYYLLLFLKELQVLDATLFQFLTELSALTGALFSDAKTV